MLSSILELCEVVLLAFAFSNECLGAVMIVVVVEGALAFWASKSHTKAVLLPV